MFLLFLVESYGVNRIGGVKDGKEKDFQLFVPVRICFYYFWLTVMVNLIGGVRGPSYPVVFFSVQ